MNKAELAAVIKEATGAHVLGVLPSSEGHSFGVTPFELLVQGETGKVERFRLGDCKLIGVHQGDGTARLELHGTHFHSDFHRRSEGSTDPEVDQFRKQFACAMSFYEDWQFLWERTMLPEFTSIVNDYWAWKHVGSWNKYPGPSTITTGPMEVHGSVRQNMGRALGKSLFTSLDAFLLQKEHTGHHYGKTGSLNSGEWYEGITPTLRFLVKWLEDACIYDVCKKKYVSVLSKEQQNKLKKIQVEIEQYDPFCFWNQVERDWKQKSNSQSKMDFVLNMADKQKQDPEKEEEMIATYIRTARNTAAHNRYPTTIEQMYLLRVGYKGIEETLSGQALDACYSFLAKLHTDVCSLERANIKCWHEEICKEAQSCAEKLAYVLGSEEIAKARSA